MSVITHNKVVFPSKNSAFKPYLPKIKVDQNTTKPVNKTIINSVIKKNNPHGYSWRAYTELEIRNSLKKDIICRNFLRSAIDRHNLELSELSKYTGKAAFESYQTIKQSLIKIEGSLKQLEHKMTLHYDYQLYMNNRH